MKLRMVLALAIVVALGLVAASSAFAVWGDSTYLAASGNPHVGYLTTSNKCGVCHAVHGAKLGGEKLLQSTAADACSYCHITSGLYTTVYGGDVNLYNGADNKGHSSLGITDYDASVGCADCHTVHGGGTVTIAGSNRNLRTFSANNSFAQVRTGYAAAGYQVVGATLADMSQWCSGCHPYRNTGLNGLTHVMRSATTTYSVGGVQMQVAWSTSAACSSCHSSATYSGPYGANWPAAALQGVAFPHYTDGVRFLNSATADNGSGSAAATVASQDGVCLKCHRDGVGTNGVGYNF